MVFHEFAHKIDMLDGPVDGTPPLPDGAPPPAEELVGPRTTARAHGAALRSPRGGAVGCHNENREPKWACDPRGK